MAFLSGISGTSGTQGTPVKSAGFLGGISSQTPQQQKIAQYKAEDERLAAEAKVANSPLELAKQTVFGIPKVLQDAGKALVDPAAAALATPVLRAVQAGATTIGSLTGNKNLEAAANQDMQLPSIFGGEPTSIAAQRVFGQGGAKQIAGDTLKYAATVYPGSSVEKTVGSALAGRVGKAALEGATGGAIAGGGYSTGEALSRPDSTAGDILKEGLKGTAIGGFLGGVLGAGGAKLAGLAEPVAGKVAPEVAAPIDRTGSEPKLTDLSNQATKDGQPGDTTSLKAPTVNQEAPTTVSKVSSDINKGFAAKGVEQLPDSELAQINSITKEDQIAKVGKLLEDQKVSDRMAATGEGIPSDVARQVLFNAVKVRAQEAGDYALQRELARSPIATERAAAAQTLGSAGFNNGPADAVSAIEEINKTRVKAATSRKLPSDAVKEAAVAKKSIRAQAARETWDSVVNNLTC